MNNQLQETIKKSLNFFRIQDNSLQGKEEEINKKIERLKKQLRFVVDDYYEKIYEILEEIISLRRKQMKKYNIADLSNEKGIGLTYSQINYIFSYKYISNETHKKIREGNLKLSTIMYIVNQDVRFRDSQQQNKVIDMYLRGEITTEEISRLKHPLIFDQDKFDERVVKADRYTIKMIYKIKGIERAAENNKLFFSNNKIFNQLCREVKILNETLFKIKEENEKLKKGEDKNE